MQKNQGRSEVLHGVKRSSSIAKDDLPVTLLGAELSVPVAVQRGYPSTSYDILCQTYAYFITIDLVVSESKLY
jgi:hypothetical protein